MKPSFAEVMQLLTLVILTIGLLVIDAEIESAVQAVLSPKGEPVTWLALGE